MNIPQNKSLYSAYLHSRKKRLVDILSVSTLVLPAIITITFFSIITLILDGLPVFFLQKRSGTLGRIFTLPKIRTLKKTADPYQPTCECDIDSNVTRIGKFLRKYRIDELPQIFLVITGKMSLVGPRPDLPGITKKYTRKQSKRLIPKPGLTGLWQIKANHNIAIHKNIKYDLYYLKKASLCLDLLIILKTIPFILKQIARKNECQNSLYPYKLSITE